MLIFLLISFAFAAKSDEKKATIKCKIVDTENPKYNLEKDFHIIYYTETSTCFNTFDGHIQVIQNDTLEERAMVVPGADGTNILYQPSITYEATDKENKDKDGHPLKYTAIPGSRFALPFGKYDLKIIYSYEIRNYTEPVVPTTTPENGNEPTTKREGTDATQTPPAETTEEPSIIYHKCEGTITDITVGTNLEKIQFKVDVTPSTRCAGNHAGVSCNMIPQQPTGLLDSATLSLQGTEEVIGQLKTPFQNVPAGEFYCQLKSGSCVVVSDSFVVKNRQDCTPTEEWLDYQIYGDGQYYFYIGFVLGCIGLLLNVIMLICSFKLCCSTEGSVEKLAESYAAEYRAKHGIEMN